MRLIITLLLISNIVCAECKPLSGSEAKKELEQVQIAYDQVNSFIADFIQSSHLEAIDLTENSAGKVYFEKGKRMTWHYLEPQQQKFVVKDQAVWLYQVDEKQVMVDNLDQVLISELPVSFLMGLGKLSSDFVVKSACQEAANIKFDLAPAKQNTDRELKGFMLEAGSNHLPVAVTILDNVQNRNKISLMNYQLEAKIDPAVFSTEYPADVDINDVRGQK